MPPLFRVVNNTGSDHVQINILDTANKMLTIFDIGCMIAVFPKGSFSILSLVKFLTNPAGYKCIDLGITPWALSS
jgi:hypothetical protein